MVSAQVGGGAQNQRARALSVSSYEMRESEATPFGLLGYVCEAVQSNLCKQVAVS